MEIQRAHRLDDGRVPFTVPEVWECWRLLIRLMDDFLEFLLATKNSKAPADGVQTAIGQVIVQLRFFTRLSAIQTAEPSIFDL